MHSLHVYTHPLFHDSNTHTKQITGAITQYQTTPLLLEVYPTPPYESHDPNQPINQKIHLAENSEILNPNNENVILINETDHLKPPRIINQTILSSSLTVCSKNQWIVEQRMSYDIQDRRGIPFVPVKRKTEIRPVGVEKKKCTAVTLNLVVVIISLVAFSYTRWPVGMHEKEESMNVILNAHSTVSLHTEDYANSIPIKDPKRSPWCLYTQRRDYHKFNIPIKDPKYSFT
ncbi:hypothetical protein WN51_12314 [Melipona quadrifasciata]|uniref:Uncharacterized protein n=1 Tax=Melipona quadrifasciata TaxID=166423 RepID=A0A0N0BH84_9HYME|nr:hypothetical protein WN51_12314 [Melipona quadrifasciata]